MKAKDAKLGSQLADALSELRSVRRALSDKPGKHYEGVHLELSAAEMVGGQGQGSSNYFYVPPELGREILDAAEKVIKRKLKALGIKP